jgi:prephenate dehydratase
MQIGFLGPQTSFSHMVAKDNFPSDSLVALNSIPAIFASLVTGEISKAIVPIENSSGGTVAITLDELIEKDIFVSKEVYFKVEHCFLARRSLENIKKIYSHPQAFAQCKNWIYKNAFGKELIEVMSTSKAAEKASIEINAGAIASKLASEKFGLDIIEEGINDDDENTTRFFIISKIPPLNKKKFNKTGIIFGVENKPGSLLDILMIFKQHNLNLLKIESRPSKKKKWEYLFFVEIQNYKLPELNEAIKKIKEKSSFYKLVGNY